MKVGNNQDTRYNNQIIINNQISITNKDIIFLIIGYW
jgi:hypothetical protein